MTETVASVLTKARLALEKQGMATARLDVRLLLSHATGLSHEEMILAPEKPLTGDQHELFQTLLTRRLAYEPVSRIMGWREFYGRRFSITPAVLDPRPDTETLIDCAVGFLKSRLAPQFLELGVGSGAIAVTLLAEVDTACGMAVDVSPQAVAVASENARVQGVDERLDLKLSNWFSSVTGRFDLIVANPPYITAAEHATLSPEVRVYDPSLALVGGDDGLNAYREIAGQARAFLNSQARLMVEIGAGQSQAVSQIFESQGFCLVQACVDLGQHIRVLVFVALELE